MIKKNLILFVLIFSSTQIFCQNSWYSAIQEYVTMRNFFGIGLFTVGGITLKKTFESYREQKRFSKAVEFSKQLEENRLKQENFRGPGGFPSSSNQNIKVDLDNEEADSDINTDTISKFLTYRTWAWGGISLASFIGSIYCLKNNFY
jgi:hypothetical protein